MTASIEETPGSVPSTASRHPAVSVVIKVTALDTSFIASTLPHMIRQAGFPFAERLVVVERLRDFSGKYQGRAKSSQRELDQTLSELLDDGTVDRVVDVDARPEAVEHLAQLYFGGHGAGMGSHSSIGCPIHATLFALEACANDYVLQLDADMLFHAAGGSWVERGLDALTADERLWLVMTHSGPPRGALGTRQSLGASNARQSLGWDAALQLFRFQSASTRYFLGDRRRLRQRLVKAEGPRGILPLECSIGASLRAHGAFRGNLSFPGSWDLHPVSHAEPFGGWAPLLVSAVEHGEYPAEQAGNYDLNLDDAGERSRWREVIAHHASHTAPAQVPKEPARIWLIVPCMGRSSFLRQTAPSILERTGLSYCLVDYACPESSGSWLETAYPEAVRGGRAVVERVTGKTVFNKCAAYNAGAGRALAAGADYLCFLDADTRVEPEFEPWLRARLRPGKFWIAGRDEGCFDALWLTGVLVVPSDAFAATDGFDEDFEGWGGEDLEMRARLHLYHGLGYSRIPLSLLGTVEHGDALRTRFYTIKDKSRSNQQNVGRLFKKLEGWDNASGPRGREALRDLFTRFAPHRAPRRATSWLTPRGHVRTLT